MLCALQYVLYVLYVPLFQTLLGHFSSYFAYKKSLSHISLLTFFDSLSHSLFLRDVDAWELTRRMAGCNALNVLYKRGLTIKKGKRYIRNVI
jgi:hypothetical protein